MALTPEFHLDYDQLVTATLEIQKVADHINEIKKRRDLVEQLIHHDKKKLDKNVKDTLIMYERYTNSYSLGCVS